MASKSEKKYRQIKRTHIGVSIFEFLLFSIISSIILTIAIREFAFYVVDTKLASEYDQIRSLAKMYDQAGTKGDNSFYDFLENEDCDYIVLDGDGSIIGEKGVNTCNYEDGTFLLVIQGETIRAYGDTEKNYVHSGKNGEIKVDFPRFEEWLQNHEGEIYKDFDLTGLGENFVNLPVWLSVDLGGGDRQFVGKAVFSANRRDVMMILSFVAAIIALIAIILITMLVTGIKNMIRQRSMISLFFTDMVTGGHNWIWFLVMGERALKKRRYAKYKLAVVNLVLINYRNYCLCHSLLEGERRLHSIYRQLNQMIGKREMCAHTTASNFALLLSYQSEEELKARLKDFFDRLAAAGDDHKFSFQAGVSLLDKAVDRSNKPISYREISLDAEYNNASAARMTLSESDDSAVAFFNDKLKEEQQWLDIVSERQQRALDNEEFMVYYQPKYDPKTDRIRGAEDLIRWNSPEYGLVPPGKFIPIFEKNGFITSIDHYMIRHVAADQKKWYDMGYHCVPVSVNVSRAHFVESNLAEQIRDMVDEAGTPHDLIEIELTESAFFDDKKTMINTINQLKSYGFAVSMDDFGSGYSSLNSLKDMPLDVLKLDAEFFRGESGDGRGEIVVSEAIRLGKLLNMRIVAEGVEVKEQVDFLASEDCDMIQGYYYAKPLPKEEYEERIK